MNCKLALLALVACFASTLAVKPENNPRIAPFLHKIGEKSYYLEAHAKAGFFNAYMFCRKHGMELVTVETNEKFEVLSKLIKDNMNFSNGVSVWTAGNDKAKDKNWSWLSNGKPLSITRWLPKQPDNLGFVEHCIAIRNERGFIGFNDAKCWNEFNFICQTVDNTCN